MTKITRILICSLAALLATPLALAQISVFPASPKPFETVRVQAAAGALGLGTNGNPDYYHPRDTQITMVGNKITVSLLTRGNALSPSQPLPLDQPVGQLPPGTYTVEVVKRATALGSSGTVGSATFTVAAKAPSDPIYDLTDMWWVAEESGWGISIVKHPSNKMFVMLYVYGADGKPTWYHVPDGVWQDGPSGAGLTYAGTLYKTTGPYFGGPFTPALVTVTPAGTASIEIMNPWVSDGLSVRFRIDGVELNKFVRRLSF